MMPGTLYIIGTPIGNLGDISARALETLRQVDVVAAEDTRHTLQLLSHFDIHRQLISFHEHSTQQRTEELTKLLKDGKNVGLVSDAGMPMVSDPGYMLVKACEQRSIPVAVIPGPSAATAVIALSGIDCRRFVFGGFLSPKQAERRRELLELSAPQLPIVLYESPNRVVQLLDDICAVLSPSLLICVAREITKLYEETLRGPADVIRAQLRERGQLRGEFALVVDAHQSERQLEDDELREQLVSFVADGMSTKDAAKYASAVLGVSRKRAYDILVSLHDPEHEGRY